MTHKLTKHGHTNSNGWKSSEYQSWQNAKSRCYNENATNYHRYGGRGISMCSRWKNSFENFIEDMGLKPEKSYQLDREEVDGNYEKDNCRWVTPQTQQGENKSSLNPIVVQGVNFSSWSAAAKVYNIPFSLIKYRLKTGWEVDDAFLTPSGKGRITKTYSIELKGIEYRSIRSAVQSIGVVSYATVKSRLNNGWVLEDAITKPKL